MPKKSRKITAGNKRKGLLSQPIEASNDEAHSSPFSGDIGQSRIRNLPDRYINRELSWLEFNRRVLEQAIDPSIPLLERIKFLSISGSNLDEFLMVRVAGLANQMNSGLDPISQDGLSVTRQLLLIYKEVNRLLSSQMNYLNQLKTELRTQNIVWLKPHELSAKALDALSVYFNQELFPLLTPLSVDPAHPFPFINNRNICLALQLMRANGTEVNGLVRIPGVVKRFINLPPENGADDSFNFITIEDVILIFIDKIFPGHKLVGHGLFRVIRDSEIEVDEEAEDLIRIFEHLLKQRRRGRAISLEISETMPALLHDFVCEAIGINQDIVYNMKDFVGFGDLLQLTELARPELRYEPYKPLTPERIKESGGDIFAAIRQRDLAVHHPYESFDVVLRFLEQASRDPNVIAIKQTLYRTSNNSPIVKTLIRAAEAGKNVTAVVELKARFDEEANMRWARDLERSGVQVVYGFIEMKTHAKLSLVLRRDNKTLTPYIHIGTGNYHPVTATTYTDLSLFSSNRELANDIAHVFNLITSYAEAEHYQHLTVAPKQLRQTLLSLINAEAAMAKEGRPAHIWMKLNALVDGEIIDALYDASQAGVDIELVVRGICCLRPGIAGLSERIRVKSIIGRFLEHARMYAFGNGERLPNQKAHVYISSADIMQRNLDRRIEVMVPIGDVSIREQVLSQIMQANMRDEKRSWTIDAEGKAHRHPNYNCEGAFDVHDYFMNTAGLSGLSMRQESET